MKALNKSVFAALLVALACAAGAGRDLPAGLQSQPSPDLGEMKAPIRIWIEGLQSDLARMLATPDTPHAQLAEACGALGNFYLAHGLAEAAETLFLNASLLAPRDVRWPYYLGLIFTDRSDYTQAEASFNLVLTQKPEDLPALVRLAGVLLKDNRPQEAGDALQRALDLKPDSAMVLFQLGEVAMGLDDAKSAVFYFEKALVQQPAATAVNYPLGLAYRKLGDIEKARYYIQRRGDVPLPFPDPYTEQLAYIVTLSTLKVALAMAAEPVDFSARDFMGYIDTHLRGKPGLVDYFYAAIEDKLRHEPAANRELARLYYAVGNLQRNQDPARATDALREATRLDPAFPEAFIELSNILIEQDRGDEALDVCNRLLAGQPDHSDGLFSRANLLAGKGDFAAAAADLDRLLQHEPKNPSSRLLYARVLEEKGDIAAAKRQFEVLAGFDLHDDEMALIEGQQGLFHQRHQNFQAAIAAFRSALERNPDLGDVRTNLAGLLAFQDRFQDAIAQYDLVLKTAPANEAARLGHVAALILSKDFARARESLQAGRTLLQDNLPIAHLLARLLAAAPRLDVRDGPRALELAQKVFDKQQTFTHAETLAMALAQAGRYDEARDLQRRLIENAAGEDDLTALLQANLALYEKNQPCCAQTGSDYLLP